MIPDNADIRTGACGTERTQEVNYEALLTHFVSKGMI